MIPSVYLPLLVDIYLTSLEPDIVQNNPSQSIGGYCSKSVVYPRTELNSSIGLYNTEISLRVPDNGWGEWAGIQYLNINSEIIKVKDVVGSSVKVVQRSINNILNMHIEDDIVYGVTTTGLFNDVLSESFKQYRCLAIKNTSVFLKGKKCHLFIRQNSRNIDTTIKIAVEIPRSQYLQSTSTSWTSMTLTDISLPSDPSQYDFQDDHFKDAYLRIKSGPNIEQGRIVNTYDSITGTFVFYNALPVEYSSSYSSNIDYEVEPAPANRIKMGTEMPLPKTNLMSSFSTWSSESSSIEIDLTKTSTTLLPNYIFYIWLERTLNKGCSSFELNNIIVDFHYFSV